MVVDDGVAVGLVLGAVENEVDTELLFRQGAEFVFVGGHVAVLLQDGAELSASLLVRLEGLQVRLDGGHRQGVDDVTVALDAETVILLIAPIAAGFEDGLELVDGGEAVIEGSLHGIGCPLLLVLAHDAVDDFLRADALLVVVYLVAIGGNAAGDDVKMVVVGVVMGVDKHGLALFTVAHFFEVLMGDVQKLLLGVLVTPAGYGEVELRFLNVLVALGVVDEILFEFVRSIGVDLADGTEVLHLKQFGEALGNLALVVIDGVESGARRKDCCNHWNYYNVVL